MNKFWKWKPILAGIMSCSLLLGSADLFQNQVFAYEISKDSVAESSDISSELAAEDSVTESSDISSEIAAEDSVAAASGAGSEITAEDNVTESSDISSEIAAEDSVAAASGAGSEIAAEDSAAASSAASWELAAAAFEQLRSEHDINALLYNAEAFAVKETPDAAAATIKTLTSGFQIELIGVSYLNHKIWYQITFAVQDQVYTGYIENRYVITSDSDFNKWKQDYKIEQLAGNRSALLRTSATNLNAFPESYRPYIQSLISAHPNWTFIPYATGLDYQTVLTNEMEAKRNLVPMTSNASWKSTDPQFYDAVTGKWIPQDSGSWAQASRQIVAYYLDPRNFLNEDSVFQFELLAYSTDHSESGVEAILNGTFMSNQVLEDRSAGQQTYAKVLMDFGTKQKISPYFLASRVRQEQGVSGSELISGTYPGYAGYYNYFNIGAQGDTKAQVILSGLTQAKNAGWSSRYLALIGGAGVVAEKYIKRGQDTLYLQKFDVDSAYDGLYWHQYMQNLQAADSEGKSVRKAYAAMGAINNSFVFKVPVYSNMSAEANKMPQEITTPPQNTAPQTPQVTNPQTPIFKTLRQRSYHFADLTWSSVSNASGYRIYRKAKASNPYVVVKTVRDGQVTSYTDAGITPNKTYYYRVRAYQIINGKTYFSGYSKTLKVKTVLLKKSLSVGLKKNTAVLKWKKNAGATGYQIYRQIGNGTYKKIITISRPDVISYSNKNLRPGTYTYKIRAYKRINGNNYFSPFSSAKRITIK